MKAVIVLFAWATLLRATAVAGPEQIIKQRARELSNQNNVRQGVAPPVQPAKAPAAMAPATPTSPGLTRLQADLAAIKAGVEVTREQRQQLARDIISSAQGATKPSFAAAEKLADDLSSAFAEKPLSGASRARLVQELDAVLNPSKYPNAKMDRIFADLQAIFQENGLARAKAMAIADDVKALAVAR